MRLSKICSSITLFSVFLLLSVQGCIQTLSLITLPVTAIQLGVTAYQSVEKADINTAVISGASKKELKKIKHIAIFMGQESTKSPYGRIGDLGAVVGDNLCIELTKQGFSPLIVNFLQKWQKNW